MGIGDFQAPSARENRGRKRHAQAVGNFRGEPPPSARATQISSLFQGVTKPDNRSSAQTAFRASLHSVGCAEAGPALKPSSEPEWTW